MLPPPKSPASPSRRRRVLHVFHIFTALYFCDVAFCLLYFCVSSHSPLASCPTCGCNLQPATPKSSIRAFMIPFACGCTPTAHKLKTKLMRRYPSHRMTLQGPHESFAALLSFCFGFTSCPDLAPRSPLSLSAPRAPLSLLNVQKTNRSAVLFMPHKQPTRPPLLRAM